MTYDEKESSSKENEDVTSVFHRSLSKSIQLSLGVPVEEQTIKRKKFSVKQWLTLITLAFGNFCVGSCISLQAPFFPNEAESKGATATEYGLIFGIYQLTVFLCSPIMGKLIGRIQPKFLLNSGIFCLGVTCICFGLLDHVYGRAYFVGFAFLIRILEGIGAAALRISCYSIIASEFTEVMSTTFAILETFFGIGLICGPTVGGVLYDAGGYGLPFYVTGSLALVDTAIIYFVLPSPDHIPKKSPGNFFKFWMSPTTIVYASVVFSTFNFIGFNGATLEPHVRQFELSGAYLGMLFALAGFMYAILAPLWGWLSDKITEKKILCIIGCLFTACALLLIGPMPFLGLPSHVGITISALILMGIGIGLKLVPAFSGTMKDTVARGFSADFSTYGLISSMFTTSQSLGAFVGPSVGGYMLDTIGYDYGVVLVLMLEFIVFIVLVVYTVAFRIKRSEVKAETEPILGNRELDSSYSISQ